MSLIRSWGGAARDFTRANVAVRHRLHERPMFDNAALAELLDRYPRDRLGVFTMGDDPVAWKSWRRGDAGTLTGAELLAEVAAGRLWLNLRQTNHAIDAYAELADEIFAEIKAATGQTTFKHDLGLLISSPNAQVFYHLDTPLVMLWQLRGKKRVWVYPRQEPFVDDAQIERVILGESAEQFDYDPAWDAHATAFDLEPGVVVSWPQNAPHRVENGGMINVSLSIEFLTPEALVRANVLYANGVLRRAVGAKPGPVKTAGVAALAKLAFARVHKLLNPRRPRAAPVPKTFEVRKADALKRAA
jgi:hypothetical protein